MSKPAAAFTFASGGTKTDPGGTKNTLGFIKERVPFEWLNWIFDQIAQWVTWIYAYVAAVDARRTQFWEEIIAVLSDSPPVLTLPGSYIASTSCALPPGYDSAYGSTEVLALAGVSELQISQDLGLTWVDTESGATTWGAVASAYRTDGSWTVVAVSQSGHARVVQRSGAAAVTNVEYVLTGTPDLRWIVYDWIQNMWVAGGPGGLWYAVNPASITWTQLNAGATYTTATIVPGSGSVSYWILPLTAGAVHRSTVTAQVPAAVAALAALAAVGSGAVKLSAYDRIGAKLIFTDGANIIWTSTDVGATIATTTTLAASSVVKPLEWLGHVLLSFTDSGGGISLRVPHGACVPAQLTTTTLAASAYFSSIACPFVMGSQVPNFGAARVLLHTGAVDTTLLISRRPRTPALYGDIA